MMRALALLLLVAMAGCTQITVSGDHNTVTTSVTTMVNGNSATIPVSALPGVP